jgi:hypothetical protein
MYYKLGKTQSIEPAIESSVAPKVLILNPRPLGRCVSSVSLSVDARRPPSRPPSRASSSRSSDLGSLPQQQQQGAASLSLCLSLFLSFWPPTRRRRASWGSAPLARGVRGAMAVTAQRFVRRNRKGRVLTVAREHYLRGADYSIDPLRCYAPAPARCRSPR